MSSCIGRVQGMCCGNVACVFVQHPWALAKCWICTWDLNHKKWFLKILNLARLNSNLWHNWTIFMGPKILFTDVHSEHADQCWQCKCTGPFCWTFGTCLQNVGPALGKESSLRTLCALGHISFPSGWANIFQTGPQAKHLGKHNAHCRQQLVTCWPLVGHNGSWMKGVENVSLVSSVGPSVLFALIVALDAPPLPATVYEKHQYWCHVWPTLIVIWLLFIDTEFLRTK